MVEIMISGAVSLVVGIGIGIAIERFKVRGLHKEGSSLVAVSGIRILVALVKAYEELVEYTRKGAPELFFERPSPLSPADQIELGVRKAIPGQPGVRLLRAWDAAHESVRKADASFLSIQRLVSRKDLSEDASRYRESLSDAIKTLRVALTETRKTVDRETAITICAALEG